MATKLREPNDIWIDAAPCWSIGRTINTSVAISLALWVLLIWGGLWALGVV